MPKVPATRLVQIKLPIGEHRALVSDAKRAGRTLSGHVRMILNERQQKTVKATPCPKQTTIRLFALFAELTDKLANAMEPPCDHSVLMNEIRQQIGYLSESLP
jgi:hypothetical protein